MPAGGILVGPMHHTTPGVPLVLAEKFHLIILLQVGQLIDQRQVMCDQHSMAIIELQDKPLVRTTIVVRRQH